MTAREIALGYLASIAGGDPDAIAAWVTEDFVNEHAAALGSGCVGRAAYRERLPGFLASFVGLVYEVQGVAEAEAEADGEAGTGTVAVAYTLRARWLGQTDVAVRGVQWLTVRDGLIAHRVDYWDAAGFLLQADPAARAALAPFGIA